jgi:hypothetical protein
MCVFNLKAEQAFDPKKYFERVLGTTVTIAWNRAKRAL